MAASQDPPDIQRTKEALALIPPECYDNPTSRGMFYVLRALVLYLLGVVGLILTDNLILLVVLWIYTTVSIGSCFVIAHDCAHGSLFKSRRLNYWAGQILMLPGFHVFGVWVHGHNHVHHAYTCNEEKDFIWHPTSVEEYNALSPFGRFMHRIYWSALGTGVYYFIEIWVKKGALMQDFPERTAKRVVKDRLIVMGFMALSTLALVGIAAVTSGSIGYGFWVWFKVLILPFLGFNYFMSVTIHMHHIHPDIPWFHGEDWEYLTGVLSSTVIRIPRVMNFFAHNIFIHMPHHLDASVPFYHLPKAAKALRARYEGQYREVPLGFFDYFRNTAACKVYDFDAQRWMRYHEVPPTGKPVGVLPPKKI